MTHPYKKFTTLKAWNVLNKAIKKLQKNNDIISETSDEYIIGYILSVLSEHDLLKQDK